jgi:hypothetical protein
MADLFERLFPSDPEVENIPVHGMHAAIVDYMAGETTEAQIIAVWSLDSEAQTDLSAWLATVDGLSGLDQKLRYVAESDAVMKLCELGLKYTTKSAFKTRLGIGS